MSKISSAEITPARTAGAEARQSSGAPDTINDLGGTYPTTAPEMMAAYDELSPPERAALAQAVENWVPQPLLAGFRRHRDLAASSTGLGARMSAS